MDILSANGVTFRYTTGSRAVLDQVTMSLPLGGIVAIMGESGCGKTTLGKILAGVLTPTQGEIAFSERPLSGLKKTDRTEYRRRVQVVQQDPYASLNPSLTVYEAVSLGVARYQRLPEPMLRATVERLFERVGLDPSREFLKKFPHQLSGGQRQRLSIARAMATDPYVIIADEAVSMLDVSMRVGILDLLLRLKEEADHPMSYVFISHDFGVVKYFAEGQRLMVLYFGRIVESGVTDDLIRHPKHPYTAALLSAVPVPDPRWIRSVQTVTLSDADSVRMTPGTGCVLVARCPWATARCAQEPPAAVEARSPEHFAACHFSALVPEVVDVDHVS